MTALRELAERWKAHADVLAARGNMFNGGMIMTKQECAAELLSILDAEGDGGAVAWQFRVVISGKAEGVWHWCNKEAHDAMAALPDNYETRQLYANPHPVRSGGVSNEDVRDAARLQWMVKNSARVIASGYNDGMFDVRWCRPDDVMHGSGHFSDWLPNPVLGWREAINAAMKGESRE